MFEVRRREKKLRQHRKGDGRDWRRGRLPLGSPAGESPVNRERSPQGANTIGGLHVVSILLTGAVVVLATLYLVGPSPEEIRGSGPDEEGVATQATPTPTPEVQLSYDGPFEAGQIVRIVNTETCLNVRTYPSVSAPVWRCLPDGSELRLVLEPVYSDTMWWWAASQEGWVAEPYLAPAEEAAQ